jgi:quercetin dioxygenase-like cupin family protein
MRQLLFSAALLAAIPASAQQPVQGSFAITWEEIQAKPTGASGMARSVLRSPTATLDELEIHVTALPAGKTTHAPHTHANEEMIVIREGTLDAYQNGKVTRVGPGSLLFMGSNEPHNVTNVGDTTAVYHVINWASPGTKQSASANPGDDVRTFYKDFRLTSAKGGEAYASLLRRGRGAAAAERGAHDRARGDPGMATARRERADRRPGRHRGRAPDERLLRGLPQHVQGDEVLRPAPAQARRRLRDRPPHVEQQPALAPAWGRSAQAGDLQLRSSRSARGANSRPSARASMRASRSTAGSSSRDS